MVYLSRRELEEDLTWSLARESSAHPPAEGEESYEEDEEKKGDEDMTKREEEMMTKKMRMTRRAKSIMTGRWAG